MEVISKWGLYSHLHIRLDWECSERRQGHLHRGLKRNRQPKPATGYRTHLRASRAPMSAHTRTRFEPIMVSLFYFQWFNV